MKSLSVNTGVILFIVGLSIFACAEVWGADWRLSSSFEEGLCEEGRERTERCAPTLLALIIYARVS